MSFIIDECRDIPNVQQRRNKVISLLEKYCHPSMADCGQIPRGCYEPQFSWPTPEGLERSLKESDTFYATIRDWLGKFSVPLFERLQLQYESNKNIMRALTTLSEKERQNLASHELPPYCIDFDEEIRRGTDYRQKIENYVFEPHLIAHGGMADIYKIKDEKGGDCVLKLFHPLSKRPGIERERWYNFIGLVLNNVCKRQEQFSHEPFIPVRFVADQWYIRNYVDGSTVQDVLDDIYESQFGRKDGWKEVAITVYGQMLEQLHHHGFVFMDHSWSGVFLTLSGIKVGDADLITFLEDANKEGTVTSRRPHHVFYASREHLVQRLPYSFSSEVESFALMAEALYNGGPWRKKINADAYIELQQEAQKNSRNYPVERKRNLPQNLQKVVNSLLTYPRDDSITVHDVIAGM